jgi:hypothetical protein
LGHRPSALSNDLAPRTRFRPTISTAAIPRVNVPSARAPASTAVSRPAPPSFASAGPLSTTVLRSPPPGFTPGGRGLQAHIRAQPGLPGPRIIGPPMMAPAFPRPMPTTAARSTASPPGSHAPVEGVSRR